MLFFGAVLHDLGLVEQFIGKDRFEIDGADAAADFLSSAAVSSFCDVVKHAAFDD